MKEKDALFWEGGCAPREKLLMYGAEALSDRELLAVFFKTGIGGLHVMDLSARILREFGSLHGLLSADYNQFCQGYGLGMARFAQLHATVELSRRFLGHQMKLMCPISNPTLTFGYLQNLLSHREREVFVVIFLDNQNQVLYHKEMFSGTLNSVEVHPREIVREALKSNAAAVILAHNHPSGRAEPSQADRRVTQRIQDACAIVDIRVLDHVVVGQGEHVSFAERGWI